MVAGIRVSSDPRLDSSPPVLVREVTQHIRRQNMKPKTETRPVSAPTPVRVYTVFQESV